MHLSAKDRVDEAKVSNGSNSEVLLHPHKTTALRSKEDIDM